jgi:cytochrome oxidase assembly protein ShyY1
VTRPRTLAFIAASIILTLLFVRLGVWQLSRLAERRAFNAELTSRAITAPVSLDELPADSALAHFRRVKIE